MPRPPELGPLPSTRLELDATRPRFNQTLQKADRVARDVESEGAIRIVRIRAAMEQAEGLIRDTRRQPRPR